MKPRLALRALILGLVLTTAVTSVITVIGMRSVVGSSEAVVAAYADELAIVGTLRETLERESSSARAFLLTGEDEFAKQMRAARTELRANLTRLGPLATTPAWRAALDRVGADNLAYETAVDRVIAARRSGGGGAAVRQLFEAEVMPARDALSRSLDVVALHNAQQLREAEARAWSASRQAMTLGIVAAGSGILAAAVLAVLLARASREVTRKRDQLAQLLARVQQSNEDLEAFGGRIAHDVRNALAPIAMASDLLDQPDLPDETRQRTTKALTRAVARTTALVDALLAFSRAGRGPESDPRSSVRVTVAGVLEELGPQVAATNTTLDAHVADVEVRCPPALLHIVLANIMGNAVKFVRASEERKVSVTSKLVKNGCELRVHDSGPGISAAACAHIFEPFFRAPGTTAPGTGIGLATVQRIVEAHGGRVSVDSTVGHGSSFLVWLPLAQDEA